MVKSIVASVILVCCFLSSTVGFAQDQSTIDEHILTAYFAQNKIKATRTPSGLYYTISQKGKGENAKAGQNVTMKYLGKFLDGKKFDSNVDDNFNMIRPLSFILGTRQVIKGWDEGVQLFNPGCRGTLYIPSGLAYGPSGRGRIPPNAVLVFDVELVSVDK